MPRFSRPALIGFVCASLLLAACTRSANPSNLPTSTPSTGGVIMDNNQEATMAAISTEVASIATQTAVAAFGVGGGEEPTPFPDPSITATPDFSALPAATPVPDPFVPGVQCTSPYTVRSGDWIYKIARACGVSAAAIIAANPGINANYIVPGQQLNLPPPGSSVTPSGGAVVSGCTGSRTVVRGDTLFRLSYNCGLTPEELAAFNGIPFPYTIFPGQVINYP